jgi:hypothetical protein
MANERLAYNATAGGSGTGYAAYSPTSNFAIVSSGWTSTAGGFAWWMSPDYTPGATGLIARIAAPGESAGTGPWTWNWQPVGNPAGMLAGEIATPTGTLTNATTTIFVSVAAYEGTRWGFGNNMNALLAGGAVSIYVRGVGNTVPFFQSFQVTALNITANPDVFALTVSFNSGDPSVSLSTGAKISIVTRDNALPIQSRSRGTMSFFRVSDVLSQPIVANLAVTLGIPGVNSGSSIAQVQTQAKLTANFWVSW